MDKDSSEEDVCTAKFLELLMQYDYECHPDFEGNFKLNLSENEKCQFLRDCAEIYQDVNELEASVKIINMKELYSKELQNISKSKEESKYSWFSLADKLFKKLSASASTDIPASQSSKLLKTPVRTYPLIQEERLTKSEDVVRSASVRDMLMKTDITSDHLPYISKRSKSLPSTSQSSFPEVSIVIPMAAFLLCPPIVMDEESMNLKMKAPYSSDSPRDIGSILKLPNDSHPGARDLTQHVTRSSASPNIKAFTSRGKRSLTWPNIKASTPPDKRNDALHSTSISSFPNHTAMSLTTSTTLDSISPIDGFSVSTSALNSPIHSSRLSPSPTAKVSISPSVIDSPMRKYKLSTSSTTKVSISPSALNSPMRKSRLSTSPTTKVSVSPSVLNSPMRKYRLSTSPTAKDSSWPSAFDSPMRKYKLSTSPTAKGSISFSAFNITARKPRVSNSPTIKTSISPSAFNPSTPKSSVSTSQYASISPETTISFTSTSSTDSFSSLAAEDSASTLDLRYTSPTSSFSSTPEDKIPTSSDTLNSSSLSSLSSTIPFSLAVKCPSSSFDSNSCATGLSIPPVAETIPFAAFVSVSSERETSLNNLFSNSPATTDGISISSSTKRSHSPVLKRTSSLSDEDASPDKLYKTT